MIELSNESLRAARAHVHRLAALTGIAAILCGTIVAWLRPR